MKRNENAEGARIEAPRRVGSGKGVSPSLVGKGCGEGAVPPPHIFFLIFSPGNGAFWALVLMLV